MRASFTLTLADGISYSANDIQVRSKGWGSDYALLVVAFECSGVLKVVPAEEVVRIEYNFAPAPAEAAV